MDKKHYTVDDLTFMISTMNKQNLQFLDDIFMNIEWKSVKVIVVNQTNLSPIICQIPPNIKVINTTKFGLSRSRNQAKSLLKSKLGVIVDDDQQIKLDYIQNIISAYNKYNFDLITFKIWSYTDSFKKYPNNSHVHGIFSILRVSSIEITAKKEVFDSTDFDENYGLGSKYPTGEEIIYLNDLLPKFKLGFVPKFISSHPKITSAHELNKKMLIAKLNMFQRIFGYLSGVLIFVAFISKQALKYLWRKKF